MPKLHQGHPAQVALNTTVRTILGLIQLLAIPAIAGWLCHYVLESNGRPEPLYAAVVSALFAFLIIRAFALVMSCTLDTLFVCSVRDKAEYEAAFMSERLHSAFGYDKSDRKQRRQAKRAAKAAGRASESAAGAGGSGSGPGEASENKSST